MKNYKTYRTQGGYSIPENSYHVLESTQQGYGSSSPLESASQTYDDAEKQNNQKLIKDAIKQAEILGINL